jgi:hypothetical protein
MLVAFLTIGVGISVLEADDDHPHDYCGWMLLETVLDGGFADHDDLTPETGPSGTLRIYLQPAGDDLFTITGNLDDPEGNHRALPYGVGNLHYDKTDGYVFTISLTGTEIREAPAPYTLFNITGIVEMNLYLDDKNGDWWRNSLVAFGVPNVGAFFHVYSWGTVSIKWGDYSKCFKLDDDEDDD